MKKRRITIIFAFVFVLLTLVFACSSFFCVENVCVVNLKLEEFNNNFVVDEIGVVGKSIFLVNKQDCAKTFEKNNPYAKVVFTSFVFPNSIQLSVVKRQKMFFITDGKICFILDKEFKVLEKTKFLDTAETLIEICGKSSFGNAQNFFEFFEFSSAAYTEGDFLEKTNKVILQIKNFGEIFENSFESSQFITKICFVEDETEIDVVFKTNKNYGANIKLCNVFKGFNKKLEKLFCAFKTLDVKEKIKTTYGCLEIDDNYNCKWNNV